MSICNFEFNLLNEINKEEEFYSSLLEEKEYLPEPPEVVVIQMDEVIYPHSLVC